MQFKNSTVQEVIDYLNTIEDKSVIFTLSQEGSVRLSHMEFEIENNKKYSDSGYNTNIYEGNVLTVWFN